MSGAATAVRVWIGATSCRTDVIVIVTAPPSQLDVDRSRQGYRVVEVGQLPYSCRVNRTWMTEQLESYLEVLQVYSERRAQEPSLMSMPLSSAGLPGHRGPDVSAYRTTPNRQFLATAMSELRRRDVLIKKIVGSLDPNLANFKIDGRDADISGARSAVERALGILAHQEEWEANLTPDAPTLSADRLHTWVWGAARTLWESKHYRSAVHAAATAINGTRRRRSTTEAARTTP
jgi:hypothetical protein